LRLGAILRGTPADEVDVDALDDAFFVARAARHGVAAAEVDTGGLRGPDRIADLTVRMSPWGDAYGERPGGLNLERLRQHEHGIDFGPSSSPIDAVLRTASGDIELAHDNILDDLSRLHARMAEPHPPLLLIGRRHVRSNNSWLHNLPALMRGRDRSTLLMHPTDADARGLASGERACVSTDAGSVEAVVEVSDAIRPGVVSLPHGFGHDRSGTRAAVARDRPGPNTNVLMPGTFVDTPSGNAAVNGVPVEVVALTPRADEWLTAPTAER
jgi:anaerobic selenocysteine-containing dehydrogenase